MIDTTAKGPDPFPTGSEAGQSVPVAEILERHPPTEKRRGRPKGSKNRLDSGSGQDSGSSVGNDVSQPVPISPLAKEQVTVAIRSLIHVVDTRICSRIRRAAEKITGDKVFALDLESGVKMEETELDTITSLSVIVIEKYNVLGSYAPEALLGCALIGYGYRVHRATSELKQLAADLNQRELSSQAEKAADNGSERDGQN